jgi:hypothetical protein
MKASKQKTDNDPAAAVETARDELQAAQNELQAFDIHKGGLNEAASRRRELQERVSIARERLQMAQARFDESEFARIENEIAELQADAQQVENELQIAREQAERDLREHLNGDWLSGQGRFASERPAIHGLLGYCNSVAEVEQRRDSIQGAIRSLERRIGDRRQELARQAAAERVDRRRKLISGEAVEIPLTPWRFVAVAGFGADVADSLERKFVPMAVVDPRGREIHCLLPSGSGPHGWADSNNLESVEQMDPTALCPAMAAVYARANPPKKRAAR